MKVLDDSNNLRKNRPIDKILIGTDIVKIKQDLQFRIPQIKWASSIAEMKTCLIGALLETCCYPTAPVEAPFY